MAEARQAGLGSRKAVWISWKGDQDFRPDGKEVGEKITSRWSKDEIQSSEKLSKVEEREGFLQSSEVQFRWLLRLEIERPCEG